MKSAIESARNFVMLMDDERAISEIPVNELLSLQAEAIYLKAKCAEVETSVTAEIQERFSHSALYRP